MEVKEVLKDQVHLLKKSDLTNSELLNESQILITSVNDNIEKLSDKFQINCVGNIEQHLESLSISNEKLLEFYSRLPTKEEYSISVQNISDVFNNQTETMTDSTTKLVNVIGTIPDGSYGLAITSGIIGAIVAAVAVFSANYFYLRHVNTNNKKAHFANVVLSLLGDFEQSSTKYWISEKVNDKRNKGQNKIEMQMLEVKIKSEFTVLRESLEAFCELLLPSQKKHMDDITKFVDEVYDIATGGDFESENKKSEKRITFYISQQCSSLKSILLKYSQHTS
jgi:hypothetical protein